MPINSAPIAANADPVSSHLAAESITASGLRDSQKREILTRLRDQSIPVTSMELARGATFDRYVAARRLPDLEHDGLVVRSVMRACSVTGRPAVTWRIKSESEVAQSSAAR